MPDFRQTSLLAAVADQTDLLESHQEQVNLHLLTLAQDQTPTTEALHTRRKSTHQRWSCSSPIFHRRRRVQQGARALILHTHLLSNQIRPQPTYTSSGLETT